MKTIFDFGVYDASDTTYYLEQGFKVVAVEANKALADGARRRLNEYVEKGQLHVIHAAISEDGQPVRLTICGDDLGSSSIFEGNVAERTPIGSYEVRGITAKEIFAEHGVPHYMKIDLEGADRLAVLALTRETKPEFLSFEVGDDFDELLNHVASIGFREFKLINQLSFRELANEGNLRDRIARKIVRLVGFAEPQFVKRGGRYFQVGHSSGPVPWCSDGAWCFQQELVAKWKRAKELKQDRGWFDLHAK